MRRPHTGGQPGARYQRPVLRAVGITATRRWA